LETVIHLKYIQTLSRKHYSGSIIELHKISALSTGSRDVTIPRIFNIKLEIALLHLPMQVQRTHVCSAAADYICLYTQNK